jgi:starch synthase
MERDIKVLFLAAEADPFIKVGGLGDVAGSLPCALRALSPPPGGSRLDVRLALPLHGAIERQKLALRPAVTFTIQHASGRSAEALETDYRWPAGVPDRRCPDPARNAHLFSGCQRGRL